MNPRLLIHLLLVVFGMAKGEAAEANQAPTVQAHRLPSGVRLTWVAQPNHRYRIETSPALTSAWTHATELLATTAEASWTQAQAHPPVPHGFFRILNLGPAPVAGLTADSAFRAADVVPLELTELFDRSGKSALEAIQVATALAPAGGLAVTNGTLRLTGSPANPVQYEPLPRDRFVLVPLQGPTVEIYVLFVDFTRGISEWRHVSEGTDVVFRSEPGAQADRATVRGQYRPTTFPGVAFDVDLASSTTGFSEIDSSGTHTLTDSTMTGRVSTEGFVQTVQTRSRFEFVSVRGISGRLESSSTSENWNNNTLVFGGDSFAWNNVKKQRSFRDGKESQLDTYWNASGTITRNGQPFGQYRKSLTPVGVSVIIVRFQVVLADRVIDVEQWTVQTP